MKYLKIFKHDLKIVMNYYESVIFWKTYGYPFIWIYDYKVKFEFSYSFNMPSKVILRLF